MSAKNKDKVDSLDLEEAKKRLEELNQKKAELDVIIMNQDNTQLAYKVFLNSVYGFTGTQYSPVFNKDIAEAVTLTGQKTIKEMVKFTNSELNKLNPDMRDEDWVIAGDTDSVSAGTMVTLDHKKMPVEEAFTEIARHGFIDVLMNGTEVAVPASKKFTTSTLLLNDAEVKNISRHRVTKKRWSIEVPGQKPLLITEDHSLIVKRDGKYIEAKPSELKPDDILVIEKS